MTTTACIALGLGCFFLLVAVLNGFRARAERRRQADVRSAALNGGTPDAPVHLESPFSPRPAASAPAVPQADAPAPVRASAPDATAPVPAEEESYVWE